MNDEIDLTKLNPKDIEQTLTPKADGAGRFDIPQQESNEAQTHLQGLKDFYKHRNRWSWFLLITIAVLITFQIVITSLIGIGTLKFENYKTVLGLIVGENFAQIVGLGLMVVKFLFNSNGCFYCFKQKRN